MNRLMLSSTLFAFLFFQIQFSFAEGESNSGETTDSTQEEKKFHNIFKSYNEQPTSNEEWSKAFKSQSPTEPSKVYQVQPGDTLWDISKTLFGDPFFWPKIWSQNSKIILNPHEITTNTSITFLPGNEDEAPDVEVPSSYSNNSNSVVSQTNSLTDHQNQNIISSSKSISKRTPKPPIPPSLPKWSMSTQGTRPKIFTFPSIVKNHGVHPSYLNFYVSDNEIEGLGYVEEIETAFSSGFAGQSVFVEMKNSNELGEDKDNKKIIGRKYLVVKNYGTITETFSDYDAEVVHLQGVIEITQLVDGESLLYKAVIIDSISKIEKGSLIISGTLPKISFEESMTSQLEKSARVIGGYNDLSRKIFGVGDIVYVNAGTAEKLKLGQVYLIYKNQILRNPDSIARTNNLPIGKLRIIHLSEHFSTASIISSKEEMMVGDSVGRISNRSD